MGQMSTSRDGSLRSPPSATLAPGTIGLTFLNALLHCPVVHSSAHPRGRIRAHGLAVEQMPWAGRSPITSGGVVAQVWRGGSGRQVPIARLLAGTDVAPIDDRHGRRAGMLLARSGQSGVIDAAVVCLAADGDDILTSDPGDLRSLAQAADIHVELIPV
jgi:hypothetical protein